MTEGVGRLSGGVPPVITDVQTGRRISLLDWKASNVRLSIVLVFLTAVILVGLAYVFALVYEPAAATFFIGIALVVAGVQSVTAYWFSDRIALAASGARPATPEEHRYLVNVTEAVSIGAGIPAPRVYVIDSPAPNAFATGRNPENAAIAVTTGLLGMLDRQELEGVVAHEIAHIRNYDILLTSMLVVLVGAILILRDVALRSMRFGGGRRSSRRNGGGGQAILMVLLVVLLVLAPILASLLRFAVSRRREYLADASAAYITRNPEGVARALEKLRDYKGEAVRAPEGVRHLFFVNPLSSMNARSWFATHPPLQDRIDRLRRM